MSYSMNKKEDYLNHAYSRALTAMGENKPNQAKMLLQNILITEPNFIPALNDLAVLYFNEGAYEQSIQLFQKIEKLNPHLDYFIENYQQVLRALNLDTHKSLK